MENNNSEKKENASQETPKEKKMSPKEFWTRLSIWTLLAVVIPVGFIIWKYGLFKSSGSIQLSGWAIIGIFIIAIYFVYLLKSAKKGMPRDSMIVQCIDGYAIIIPLIALLLIVKSVKNTLAEFEQVLIVIIVCESIAVPINPMRKWAAQNNIERGIDILSTVISTSKKKARSKKDEK